MLLLFENGFEGGGGASVPARDAGDPESRAPVLCERGDERVLHLPLQVGHVRLVRRRVDYRFRLHSIHKKKH